MPMPMDNFEIFSERAYLTRTEVVAQEVAKFNAASGGTITLKGAKNVGDFNKKAFFGEIAGLIRNRDPYGTGTVAEVQLRQLQEQSVKVARGTPPVVVDEQMFTYVQQDPKLGGTIYGRQLAVAMVQDMLNTAIGAGVAMINANTAVGGQNAVVNITGDTKPHFNPQAANKGVRPFGDRANLIRAWVMHSNSMNDYYGDNLANAEQLYSIEGVNVSRDPFGRLFIQTDCPALINDTPDPDLLYVLGLVAGGLYVEDNNDYRMNYSSTNGNENIHDTIQSEWTYNVGGKRTKWKDAAGGKVPNAAALNTSTNWENQSTDIKNTPGVLMVTNPKA